MRWRAPETALLTAAVVGALPASFGLLWAEARAEGHRFMERLALDWHAGAMRFDHPGEVLLAGHIGGALACMGGLTREPGLPDALRMRRFYVRPGFRRRGAGRQLAAALLGRAAQASRRVTVNAGTADAAAFWEAVGFAPDRRGGWTHAFSQPQR